MEYRKNISSSSDERQDKEKIKKAKNSKSAENKNEIDRSLGYGTVRSKNLKPSQIPVMRNEKVEPKSFVCKKRPMSLSKPLTATKTDRKIENIDYKLKVLKEKERSIAEYYCKIEEMIQKLMSQKEDDKKLSCNKICGNSAARKMISDPSVFSKTRLKSEISDFENNIQQISSIWLKTTSDLSSTLNSLKSNPYVNPLELQMENIRIQLAIKQAKSLTLIKTRSVIAEAKKLFQNREIIRSELECLLKKENSTAESQKDQKLLEGKPNKEEQDGNGTGDSFKGVESSRNSTETISGPDERSKRGEKDNSVITTKSVAGDAFSDEKFSSSEETKNKQTSGDEYPYDPATIISDMGMLKKELCRKNKTITNLNKKIFDLQKTCNENSAKYNQLQVKLLEFQEKNQWNQVLWKQITKLKERIKSLQLCNKELEFQKRELESKIVKRDQEIDRLQKLNHILNQRKHILNSQEITVMESTGEGCKHMKLPDEVSVDKYCKKTGQKACIEEKIIAEKETAINHLKKILNVMKDQEIFAQKQISMFQSRIAELEKNGKM